MAFHNIESGLTSWIFFVKRFSIQITNRGYTDSMVSTVT